MGARSRVPSVDRALAILRHLAAQPRPVSAPSIARELNIPRSSTYHLLAALRAQGFVVHLEEERRYGLGVASFEIGSAYIRRDGLERLARPKLIDLAATTGFTAHFAILDGREVLYLIKEQPQLAVPLVTDVGVRLPAHLTASGRSLLARSSPQQVRALYPRSMDLGTRTGRGPSTIKELADVLEHEREQGWSMEDGEVSEHMASVATATFDHLGEAVASVAVTFHRDVASESHVTQMAAHVRHTADELTARWRGGRHRGRPRPDA